MQTVLDIEKEKMIDKLSVDLAENDKTQIMKPGIDTVILHNYRNLAEILYRIGWRKNTILQINDFIAKTK